MKRYARNVCAFILAASMMIPLAGCKKGKGKKKSSSSGPRQEYVKEDDPYFSCKEVPLVVDIPTDSDKEVEYSDVYNMRIVGDMVVCDYYISYKMPKEVEEKLYSVDFEEDYDYEEIEKLAMEYYTGGMVIFDYDGNIVKLINGDGLEGFNQIAEKKDGGFYAVRIRMTNDCRSVNELVTFNDKFEEVDSVTLDEEIQDIDTIYELDSGNFLFNGYNELYIVGKDGHLVASSEPEGWIYNYFVIDGKVYGVIEEYDEKTYISKIYLQEVDEKTAEFKGDKIDADWSIWSASQGKDGIYASTDEGVQKLDVLKGESETILEWNWTDINFMNNYGEGSINVVSEDKILLTKMEYEEAGYKAVGSSKMYLEVLTREDKNPHAGKRILQIGTLGGSSSKFYDQVIKYNLDPDRQARIQMKFYTDDEPYDSENYMKSLGEMSDKIYLEMLSGDGPDILMDFSGYSQFDTDDILVDLNTYIDGDKGLNRDDYFDNIFRAFETSGKLYHIPVTMDITGYVGNKDLIGERTGWTYDEFDQIASNLPQNVSIIQETEWEGLLEELLRVSLNSFIDYGTKEVKFDSPDFKKALEISKKYGVEKVTEEGGYVMDHSGIINEIMMMEGDDSDPFKEGLQALRFTYIYGIRNYVEEYQALKDKTVFVGVPSPDGTGMTASPNLTLAIAASSKCKDEAWDFISFFFEEETQKDYSIWNYSIPINRNALDAKNADDIKYYEDEKKYFDEMKDMYPDEYPDEYFYEITPEMQEDFVKLVESVSTSESIDPAIIAIIQEDSAPYFKNQKSADDVCKLIQNRAKTKVNER